MCPYRTRVLTAMFVSYIITSLSSKGRIFSGYYVNEGMLDINLKGYDTDTEIVLERSLIQIANRLNGALGGPWTDGTSEYSADIMFLLDASSSIESTNFTKQLNFTQDVVKIFDIGRLRTKVGVALFSDTVYPEFNFDSFNSKGHIVNRIGNIIYRGGRTNTAEALSFVRNKIFTKDKARPGVPRIAIVLTDGLSNYPEKTLHEAKELQLIGVIVFVIGIGSDVDDEELKNIASKPSKDYLFHVNDFNALSSIKQTLAIKACGVEYVDFIVQQDILDTDTFFQGRLPCSINIVYGADVSSASRSTVKQIMTFFTMINDQLQDDLFKVRSAQIINNCPSPRTFPRRRGKSYAPLLLNMRQASPASLPTMVNHGKAMNILLIDTSISDLARSIKEVLRARFKNIDTFTVVVGTEVSRSKLERFLRIRSDTSAFSNHVFAVDNYDKLEAAILPLIVSIKKLKCS